MGETSKVQRAQEQVHEQWQLPVPSKVAQQLAITADDNLEWIIVDQHTVVLHRTDEPFVAVKKKPSSITRLFW